MSILSLVSIGRRVLAVGSLSLFAAAPIAHAQPVVTPKASAEAQAIKKQLEEKFPGARVTNVSKSPYFGLYEAQFEDRLVYTDAKVQYVIVGSVYDTATKANLTEQKLRRLNRIAFNSLPLDLAFKRVKGNGSRVLALFSDADCPFCAQFEQSLKQVDDVTIYTFLFPIDQLHPDAARKSKAIWCAPDRAAAWNEFFATGALPDNSGDCGDPVEATAQLGMKLRITATPTLVFADGSVVPGALPAERLEAELRTAEAEAKKLGAAKK